MTLDNMTGITKGSYTGFCKSQLITCNRVKECNGVCPFEDALKHADKMQTMNEQHTVDHDRDWIIGCIEHDGFIHTHRFDKANQIILDALSARPKGEWNTHEVACLLADMFDDTCACNYCGIDEWLPMACRYVETGECPNPKEKNGCWMEFLMQGGADMRGEDDV